MPLLAPRIPIRGNPILPNDVACPRSLEKGGTDPDETREQDQGSVPIRGL